MESKNKNILILLILAFAIQSCENKTKKVSENEPAQQMENNSKVHPSKYDDVQNGITLGEGVQEISCYVKDIYEKNDNIYVDLDFVEIQYKNVDERVIVNKNPKIRTYIVDIFTEIAARDKDGICEKIDEREMLKRKNILLKDKTTIVIGESEDGRMVSINFGCYG